MDILFISPTSNPLIGEGDGSIQRTNLLFEAFARLGSIDIISFQDDVRSDRENCRVLYSSFSNAHGKRPRIAQFFNTIIPISQYSLFPKDKFREKIVKSFIRKKDYDIIVCRYFAAAMSCGLMEYSERLVIDIDDTPYEVEKLISKTATDFKKKMFHWYRSLIINHLFKKLQSKCRLTFYSNPVQAIFKNSVYLPNIPYYDYNIPPADFNKTGFRILFVGNLDYTPNSTGINYFIDNIYPMVCEAVPSVELQIVGKCSRKNLVDKWEQTAGVHFIGYANNLKKEYIESRVVIIPINDGAGTNIKVLEAMKMKRPCVTTERGYRGFKEYFSNGVELFVSDTNECFAKNVINLLTNQELNHKTSYNAFNSVINRFSLPVFYEIVSNAVLNTHQHKPMVTEKICEAYKYLR